MTAFENLSQNQKIRATLHRDIRNVCIETCHYCGLEITNSAVAIIAELVLKKIKVYGLDLEAFAKHAKRATINSGDVKLLARRNLSLQAHLDKLCANPSTFKGKPRKTILSVVKSNNALKKKKHENVLQDSPLEKKHKNEEKQGSKQVTNEKIVNSAAEVKTCSDTSIDLTDLE